jgi:hypothetical protein
MTNHGHENQISLDLVGGGFELFQPPIRSARAIRGVSQEAMQAIDLGPDTNKTSNNLVSLIRKAKLFSAHTSDLRRSSPTKSNEFSSLDHQPIEKGS